MTRAGTELAGQVAVVTGAATGLTRALARELGPDNILVNQVAPGFTLSDGVAGCLDGFSATRASAPGQQLTTAPWQAIIPCIVFSVTIFALYSAGEWLRAWLDVRGTASD
jgi:NAD(P)-dependent dehydrogenase (short-subunit alcohol dehydrogenase family)